NGGNANAKNQITKSKRLSAVSYRLSGGSIHPVINITHLIKKSKDKSEALSSKSEDAVGTRQRRVRSHLGGKLQITNHKKQIKFKSEAISSKSEDAVGSDEGGSDRIWVESSKSQITKNKQSS